MIKLIDSFEKYDFSSFEDDIFFQRICSEFASCSSFSDSLFYVSVTDDKVNAVISKVGGGNVTLSALGSAPFEEISEFFSVIGFSVILCEEKFSAFFCGEKTCGNVLKIHSNEKLLCKVDLLYSENLKDMFSLLKQVFDIDYDYMFWLADMSHKLRHNSATFCGIYFDDELVSAAFSLFETDSCAVLSSVATLEKHRKKGYGEKVVKTLLDYNFGKDVYVFTDNEKAEIWYKKMGFVPYKKWSEIKNVL